MKIKQDDIKGIKLFFLRKALTKAKEEVKDSNLVLDNPDRILFPVIVAFMEWIALDQPNPFVN